MKDKIILFIIGTLVGAVISTGAFYIYTITNNNNCSSHDTQISNAQPPEMPNGQNGENGQPPEKPDNNNTQENSQENNS